MGSNGFSWGRLLMGIIFIIAALVSFRNPLADLIFLAVLFGVIAISNGIWLITNRNGSAFKMFVGVLDIVIGCVFIFNLGLSVAAIPYIFAFWFIVNAVANLMTVGYARAVGTGFYWLTLILNVLCIIIGIGLMFNPVTSAFTAAFLVGFYFMLAGIEYIVTAFQV